MNAQPTKWDAADPQESLFRFAAFIHEKARETFLKDKTHVEIIFLARADGQMGIIQPHGEDRDAVVAQLKEIIAQHKIYGVVHICEAWMRLAAGPNDHTLKQIMLGEIKVSELLPEHRKEALTVTVQSRDGLQRTWIAEILRDEGAKAGDSSPSVRLGESKVIEDMKGRFGELFG